MINTTIVPMPIYMSSDNSSYYEKCIESSEFKDIREKILLNKGELSEDEVKRISNCIDEKENSAKETKKILIVILIVVLISIPISAFIACLI